VSAHLIQGDVLHLPLADNCVQACVCSPPYWGLRAYLPNDHPLKPLELGHEESPDEYVDHLVLAFREVRRVIRSDGVLFLNLGDAYAQDSKWGGWSGGKNKGAILGGYNRHHRTSGRKEKDLLGLPWLVALALQADGWWLRNDCIWEKTNGMTESVEDRFVRNHEYIFLLAKSRYYYFDKIAVLETAVYDGRRNLRYGGSAKHAHVGEEDGHVNTSSRDGGPRWTADDEGRLVKARRDVWPAADDLAVWHYLFTNWPAQDQALLRAAYTNWCADLANPRGVWSLACGSYDGAHYATFPTDLVRTCVLAATSAVGCCPVCRAPYKRLVEKVFVEQPDVSHERGIARVKAREGIEAASVPGNNWQGVPRGINQYRTLGWAPVCDHGVQPTLPCRVLDPFAGSGTVAQVCLDLGRSCLSVELNPAYLGLQTERVTRQMVLGGQYVDDG
jgi:DNA modification methylase